MTTARHAEMGPGAVAGAGYYGQTPGIMRACEECHRKKTKCDMARPTCGLCLRTGSSCQFPSRRRPSAGPSKRQKTHEAEPDGKLAWLLNLISNADGVQLLDQPTQSTQSTTAQPRPSDLQNRAPSVDALISEQLLDQPAMDAAVEGPEARQELPLPDESVAHSVSYDLAMDLVEAFFDHIQPWLPALHKPRFLAKCVRDLRQGPDALRNQGLEMKLLLNSMFALSARFSTSPLLSSVRPVDRDRPFVVEAHHAYAGMRSTEHPTLIYLQGCILLAFHAYTAELNSPAWILTGVCVRLVYDLGLSEVDDDSFDDQQDRDPVVAEEMRRAWWLTWELDTFGSMVTRRPFAVDRHHFTVHLPNSDADWFSENIVRSAPLVTPVDQAWRSLQDSENQNPRAWFLITNHLLSLLFKQLCKRPQGSRDNMTDFKTAFNCLRLSLPASFQIFRYPPSFTPNNFATYNWIMGTHLMLTNIYSFLASLRTDELSVPSSLSDQPQSSDGVTRYRSGALSQLIMHWPVEYMIASHPFFVCSLMPSHIATAEQLSSSQVNPPLEGVEQMVELILIRFTERWKLAAEMLAVLQEIRRPENENGTTTNTSLRRRFATYFPRKSATNFTPPASNTHAQHTIPWDSSQPLFDYQYFITTPQTHRVAEGTDHLNEPDLGEGRRDTREAELPSFGLTPTMALSEIMLGQDSEPSYRVYSDLRGVGPGSLGEPR